MELTLFELVALALVAYVPFHDKVRDGALFDRYSDFAAHH